MISHSFAVFIRLIIHIILAINSIRIFYFSERRNLKIQFLFIIIPWFRNANKWDDFIEHIISSSEETSRITGSRSTRGDTGVSASASQVEYEEFGGEGGDNGDGDDQGMVKDINKISNC